MLDRIKIISWLARIRKHANTMSNGDAFISDMNGYLAAIEKRVAGGLIAKSEAADCIEAELGGHGA